MNAKNYKRNSARSQSERESSQHDNRISLNSNAENQKFSALKTNIYSSKNRNDSNNNKKKVEEANLKKYNDNNFFEYSRNSAPDTKFNKIVKSKAEIIDLKEMKTAKHGKKKSNDQKTNTKSSHDNGLEPFGKVNDIFKTHAGISYSRKNTEPNSREVETFNKNTKRKNGPKENIKNLNMMLNKKVIENIHNISSLLKQRSSSSNNHCNNSTTNVPGVKSSFNDFKSSREQLGNKSTFGSDCKNSFGLSANRLTNKKDEMRNNTAGLYTKNNRKLLEMQRNNTSPYSKSPEPFHSKNILDHPINSLESILSTERFPETKRYLNSITNPKIKQSTQRDSGGQSNFDGINHKTLKIEKEHGLYNYNSNFGSSFFTKGKKNHSTAISSGDEYELNNIVEAKMNKITESSNIQEKKEPSSKLDTLKLIFENNNGKAKTQRSSYSNRELSNNTSGQKERNKSQNFKKLNNSVVGSTKNVANNSFKDNKIDIYSTLNSKSLNNKAGSGKVLGPDNKYKELQNNFIKSARYDSLIEKNNLKNILNDKKPMDFIALSQNSTKNKPSNSFGFNSPSQILENKSWSTYNALKSLDFQGYNNNEKSEGLKYKGGFNDPANIYGTFSHQNSRFNAKLKKIDKPSFDEKAKDIQSIYNKESKDDKNSDIKKQSLDSEDLLKLKKKHFDNNNLLYNQNSLVHQSLPGPSLEYNSNNNKKLYFERIMNNDTNRQLSSFAYSKYIDNNIAKLFDLRKNQSSSVNQRENNFNEDNSEEPVNNFDINSHNYSKSLNKNSNVQTNEDDNVYTRKYRRNVNDKTNPDLVENVQNNNAQTHFVVQVPAPSNKSFSQKPKQLSQSLKQGRNQEDVMTQQNPKTNYVPITVQTNNNLKKRKDLSFKFNNIGSPNSSPSHREKFCKYYMNEVYKAFYTEDPNYFSNLFRQHLFQTIQAYSTFRFCSMVHIEEINKRLVNLPDFEKGVNKTLIFDLDETLIHCTEAQKTKGEITQPITFANGDQINVGINTRPYAKYALEELSKYYQVIIFTASHSAYANKVLDHLDPQNKFITHRLFREHCVYLPQGVYTKDLRIFNNRKLSELILVDNSPHTYVFHKSSGVPIIPFYDNYDDNQQLYLVNYLKTLCRVGNQKDRIVSDFKHDKILHHVDSFERFKKEVLGISD